MFRALNPHAGRVARVGIAAPPMFRAMNRHTGRVAQVG
jgi:hypothetical protein